MLQDVEENLLHRVCESIERIDKKVHELERLLGIVLEKVRLLDCDDLPSKKVKTEN